MFKIEYSIEILIDSDRVTIYFSKIIGFKEEIPKILHVRSRLLEVNLFFVEIFDCFIPTPNKMIVLFRLCFNYILP
jgi:hypothetical protein